MWLKEHVSAEINLCVLYYFLGCFMWVHSHTDLVDFLKSCNISLIYGGFSFIFIRNFVVEIFHSYLI